MFLTPKQLGLNQQQIDEICERLWKEDCKSSKSHCNDCNAAPGERHMEGCDVTRCTSCGCQRLGCNCEGGEPDIWTGLWPGIKECYEQKLICFDTCPYPKEKELNAKHWCFDLNEWVRSGRKTLTKTSIPEEEWNVHSSHCSAEHCKYGDKDCPVALGLVLGISIEDYEK